MDTNSTIYKFFKFLLFYWSTILFIYLIYGAYVICTITTYWINYRWFVFASFMIFIFITSTISFVAILKIIKLSNQINKPIPKKNKNKIIFVSCNNVHYSSDKIQFSKWMGLFKI